MLGKLCRMVLRCVIKPIRWFLPRMSAEPTDKADWEFWWQQTQWLHLWTKPGTQEKCLEYWQKFRHLDDIRSLAQYSESTYALDVGCGLSSVLHYLTGRRCAVDPLAERYKAIYKYPFPVIEASGESLPFEADTFDLVFCSNCIDHTTSPTKTISEVRRVLKVRGWFVLTCEIFANDLGERNVGHPHSLTAGKLLELARDFEIVAHWDSPWYGMRNYVIGGPPTEQREHILLLRKAALA
jgi:SAM-dependent methyltransferase